jgi:hypothetical protein
MNRYTPLALSLLFALAPCVRAQEKPDAESPLVRHQKNSEKLAKDQDELTANVTQVILEQTAPPVIKLFEEVKGAMNDSTDHLSTHDTGGDTIAAQTDVIEKIIAAAEERQKQQGGQSGGAMLDMMKGMAGKLKPGDKPGGKAGNQPGKGQTGDSQKTNDPVAGSADGKDETRRVPKAAGTAGQPVPPEFRQALDAYNRGADKLAK